MQHRAMLPLSTWPAPERRGLAGLFTDIDDTLTCEGVIAPAALQALHDLRGAGLHVIAITGRAIGWCHQHIAGERAAPWPVDAIVAENGALAWVCRTPLNARATWRACVRCGTACCAKCRAHAPQVATKNAKPT